MQHERTIERAVEDFEAGRITRRDLVARLGAIAATAWAGARLASAQETEASPTFVGTDLNHIALRVTDLERSRDFYAKHLGLETASFSRWNCFMRCRDHNFLALFKSDAPGMDHFCFSIPEFDVDDVQERLERTGLAPRRQENRIYFDDPDGIEVQLAAQSHGV